MKAEKLKVMVVDDSAAARGFWIKVIDAQSDMSVVTTAINVQMALNAFDFQQPDLVILNLEMLMTDDLSVIPLFLSKNGQAKILVSTSSKESEMTLKALRLGAADSIARPSAENGMTEGDISNEIIQKIKFLVDQKTTVPHLLNHPVNAIAIGASTGGPDALVVTLKDLSPELTQPIFIVQHMPASFIDSFAKRIAASSGRPCLVGTHRMRVEPSTIYLAPGDFHMTIEKTSHGHELCLNSDLPENFCRPAVDPLFRSAASAFGKNLLAFVLTGMGMDGKSGAEMIKAHGGKIIAQDEESSVVWGMPGAVVRSGLADYVQNLEDISKTINSIFKES